MKENKKEEVVVKRKFKFVKFLVVILILYIILFLGYKLFTAKIKNIMKIVQESYMAIAANASGKIVWEAALVKMNIVLKED